MIPAFVDVLNGVVILANAYIIRALSCVGVVGPDSLSFDFTREVICSPV
jgi:hypothetical protein